MDSSALYIRMAIFKLGQCLPEICFTQDNLIWRWASSHIWRQMKILGIRLTIMN